MKVKMLIIFVLLTIGSSSFAAWTKFAEIGQLQNRGDNGMQVWLKGVDCPNENPYFSITRIYTTNVDTIVSMILMAKASKIKVKFEYNTSDNSMFCSVTGIQVQ